MKILFTSFHHLLHTQESPANWLILDYKCWQPSSLPLFTAVFLGGFQCIWLAMEGKDFTVITPNTSQHVRAGWSTNRWWSSRVHPAGTRLWQNDRTLDIDSSPFHSCFFLSAWHVYLCNSPARHLFVCALDVSYTCVTQLQCVCLFVCLFPLCVCNSTAGRLFVCFHQLGLFERGSRNRD